MVMITMQKKTSIGIRKGIVRKRELKEGQVFGYGMTVVRMQ